MSKTLPVLGSEGWLRDPEQIMTRLFTDMFLTDHSQSNIYMGQVMSLQYYLTTLGSDPHQLTMAVEEAMTRYYSHYFKGVQCEFKHSATNGSEMTFDVRVEGSYNGIKYNLSRQMMTDSSTGTQRFVEAFNYNGEVM